MIIQRAFRNNSCNDFYNLDLDDDTFEANDCAGVDAGKHGDSLGAVVENVKPESD